MTTTFANKAPDIDPSGTAGLPSIPDNFEADGPSDGQNSALNQDAVTVVTPQTTPAADDTPTDTSTDDSTPATDTPAPSTTKPFDADLLSLKQQALSQLEPLVDKLDQTPEEKFRTTMMLIQGADNQALIKTAYEAAQQITDEKAKAQALLDVVNEINYFAQKSKTD